ncbi:hypothetical protein FB451DRAFT_1265484 [Mycena latifolia]|nr:hypothetical protein FB451DRAFT_1265484 [Mycena latifolia]
MWGCCRHEVGGVVSHVCSFELLILEVQNLVVESGAADAGVRSTPGRFVCVSRTSTLSLWRLKDSDKTSKQMNRISPSSTLSCSPTNAAEYPALHGHNAAAVPAAPEAPLKRPTKRPEPWSVDAQVRNAAVTQIQRTYNGRQMHNALNLSLCASLLRSGRGCDQAPRPSSSSLEHTRGLRVAGHRGAYWYHLPVP